MRKGHTNPLLILIYKGNWVLTLRNLIISVLLILAVTLSAWSILMTTKPAKIIATDASDQPDAFIEGVSTVILNKQGLPTLKVQSPKMVHYQLNDSTDIEKPHIIVYRDSPEPWHIHAEYAKATHGLDQIVFWDHVLIFHKSDPVHPTTTMRTSTLTVLPNQQIAKTADPVLLLQPDTTIHAIGMLANMKEGTVKLLSEARGDYVPSS